MEKVERLREFLRDPPSLSQLSKLSDKYLNQMYIAAPALLNLLDTNQVPSVHSHSNYSLLGSNFAQLSPMYLRASDIHSEPVATGIHCMSTQKQGIETHLSRDKFWTGDATQWLISNSVPREDLNSLNIFLLFHWIRQSEAIQELSSTNHNIATSTLQINAVMLESAINMQLQLLPLVTGHNMTSGLCCSYIGSSLTTSGFLG